MKPVYEIVRAAELRVGDVVLDLRGGATESYVIDTEFVEIARGSPKNFYPPKIRQLPPERNPEVLMRALEVATETHIEAFSETVFRTADDWIEQARGELESEAKRGA